LKAGGGMMTKNVFHAGIDAKCASIWRLLRRVRHRLSCTGDAHPRRETELCRLSGLPSCCFSHFADKQK
jgi:hypothetical protein